MSKARSSGGDSSSKSERNNGLYQNPTENETAAAQHRNRSGSGSGNDPRRDVTNDSHSNNYDQETLDLVKGLKEKLENRSSPNASMTNEELIETEVRRIRRERNHQQLNVDRWRKKVPEEYNGCSDDILNASMAYGDDPEQVKKVIEAKMNKRKSNPTSTISSDEPSNTLPREMICTLKEIDTKLHEKSLPNLLDIVCNTEEDQLDRLDRLFYSEGCRILGSSENYTFENAHDQVQAIRMMNYTSKDDEELRILILKHRNFDDAYNYLGKCVKTKMDKSSTNKGNPNSLRPASGSVRGRGSVIGDPDNDPDRMSIDSSKTSDPKVKQDGTLINSRSRGLDTRDSIGNQPGGATKRYNQ